LHEVESALRDVYQDAPLGSMIVPMPDGSADDMNKLRGAFRGRRGSTLVVEGVAQATAAGMHPQLGKGPDHLSPDLSRSMTAETLEAARGAICAVFGALPALFHSQAQGPLVREAQRHLAMWTLQPVAALLAEEATAKLGNEVMIDTLRPLQAYDVGGRARAFGALIEGLGRAKELELSPAEINGALTMVNWGEGDRAA
jgi:hypothetical protein